MQQPAVPPSAATALAAASWKRLALLPWRTLLTLALLIAVSLGLRLYHLGIVDYWDDEVISIFAARQPALDIFRTITVNDTHPPLYHVLLHFWRTAFGEQLTTLRLFSALVSAACVPLLYLLGRELAGSSVGLVAAALMAIAPFQIYHGQQARMYPLLTLMVLLTTLCFVQAWRRGGWLRWAAVGLCAAAGFYTHVYFAFSLMGLNLWAVWETASRRRIDWRRWAGLLLAQLLAVLAFVPFLPQMFGLTSSVIGSFWIRENTPVDWLFALISLSNYATVTLNRVSPWHLVATYLPAIAALCLALVYSLREAYRHPDERSAWMVLQLSLWTPLIVVTILALTIRPILLDRSFIGLSGPLFLLMAWMAVRFARYRPGQLVAAAFVLTCLAAYPYIYPATLQLNRYRDVTDYLVQERRQGDAIAYADWQSFDTSALLHPELPDVFALLPTPAASRTQWQQRMTVMRRPAPQNVGMASEFAPRYRRLWLLLTDYTPAVEEHRQHNLAWLEQHGRLVEERRFGAGVLYLYEIRQ